VVLHFLLPFFLFLLELDSDHNETLYFLMWGLKQLRKPWLFTRQRSVSDVSAQTLAARLSPCSSLELTFKVFVAMIYTSTLGLFALFSDIFTGRDEEKVGLTGSASRAICF
jgi:hypothetical protein